MARPPSPRRYTSGWLSRRTDGAHSARRSHGTGLDCTPDEVGPFQALTQEFDERRWLREAAELGQGRGVDLLHQVGAVELNRLLAHVELLCDDPVRPAGDDQLHDLALARGELGKPGVAGDSMETFNRPSAVITAPNGDIYVSDGHGGDSNARIMKFAKDGNFIKTWGKKGAGPGEFGELHGIALDSSGRVFVADRGNNRIQIFDAEGKYIAEWKQFGRPSGIYIDASDTLYVTDHASDAKRNPGMRRGVRVGSAKDGTVRSHIPGVGTEPDKEHVPEGVAADGKGAIYGAQVALKNVTKYVRN